MVHLCAGRGGRGQSADAEEETGGGGEKQGRPGSHQILNASLYTLVLRSRLRRWEVRSICKSRGPDENERRLTNNGQHFASMLCEVQLMQALGGTD